MEKERAMTSPLVDQDIVELAGMIAARTVSPVAVMEAFLERVASVDPTLQSFIHLSETALEQARHAEALLQQGAPVGPLHGIPLAIKDNYLTRDMPTTAGSTAPGYDFALRDGTAVRRLREAGAIPIGKTRTHEFAWGTITPLTRNPWDLSRIPGGSSGGSGAAVAARLVPGGLGSDTGGSIRIPASLCGVVGLKPTFGRISRDGIVPHSWSLDHAGPLTRSVRDAALLLNVMAGYDPHDTACQNQPVPDYLATITQPIAGLKIGICRNHFFGANEPDVEQAVERAIDDLANLGAHIVELHIDHLEYGLGAIFAIELASSSAYHDRALQSGATAAMNDDVRTLVEIGRMVTAADMVKAEQLRAVLMHNFKKAFEQVDVMLTPTMPLTAWKADQTDMEFTSRKESPLEASWRLTYPFNLTGMPAISVPCGFDRHDLPIGLQLAAAPFDEVTLLRVAHAYETIHRWGARTPPLQQRDNARSHP
jgi:aspartyl-tRNA(Asn)/glutamyl-tRNA(Gln) amidotransferase subunit A